MEFTFSQEQDDFRSAVATTLAAEAPPSYVRQMIEDPVGVTPELWSTMAELGWLGSRRTRESPVGSDSGWSTWWSSRRSSAGSRSRAVPVVGGSGDSRRGAPR